MSYYAKLSPKDNQNQKKKLWIAASAAGAAVVNPNGIKTLILILLKLII